MDTCFIIGIIRGAIILLIGVVGIINVNNLANIYVAIILSVIGLMTFAAAYNIRETKT